MQWKVPSEHTVDNKQYAAELQIFHGQPANKNMVVLSYLFDTDIQAIQSAREAKNAAAKEKDPKAKLIPVKTKTCFVESFKFTKFNGAS